MVVTFEDSEEASIPSALGSVDGSDDDVSSQTTDSENSDGGTIPYHSPPEKLKFLNLALRLKNLDDEYDKTTIFQYFSEYADKVIVSQEQSKKKIKHFHVYVDVTDWETIDEARLDIIDFFKITQGNKQYCLQEIRDDTKYKSYCVKDHDYLQKGFTDSEMDLIVSHSYAKYDKATFAAEFEIIINRWKDTNDDTAWIFDYCALKSKYGQLLNRNNVIQRLDSLKCSDTNYCAKAAISMAKDLNCRNYDQCHEFNEEKEYDRLILRSKSLEMLIKNLDTN